MMKKKYLQLKDFEKNTLKLSYGKKKHFLIKNYLETLFLSTIF